MAPVNECMLSLSIHRHECQADTMTGPQRPIPVRGDDDDVQGHAMKWGADAESAEDDDTEAHAARYSFADSESAESDDTEGHRMA